jgi:hypothetical protein
MRRSLWCVLVAACGNPPPQAPPPLAPSNVADPAVARPFRIDRASLPDCSALSVLKQASAGISVTRCGELAADATPAQIADALRCVTDAVATNQPFVVHQWVRGIDSLVGIGALGRISGGAFVVDELDYDSDPCGGSCPERGHTDVTECAKYTRTSRSDCARNMLAECFACDGKRDAGSCVQGGSAVSR